MKKIFCFLASLALVLVGVGISYGMNNAEEIVEKSFSLYRLAKFEEERISIAVSKGNRTKEKALYRYTYFDVDGNDKVSIKFFESKRDKGTAILIHYGQDGNRQWMKLSRQKKMKLLEIGSSKYILGTDLTNEDAEQLIRENTSLYDYSLISDTNDVWMIEARPKQGVKSAYSKRVFHIDKNFVIRSIEYFQLFKRSGEEMLLKTQVNKEITRKENGFWRANLIIIDNIMLGRQTILKVEERKLRDTVSESAFSKNFLLSSRERI